MCMQRHTVELSQEIAVILKERPSSHDLDAASESAEKDKKERVLEYHEPMGQEKYPAFDMSRAEAALKKKPAGQVHSTQHGTDEEEAPNASSADEAERSTSLGTGKTWMAVRVR